MVWNTSPGLIRKRVVDGKRNKWHLRLTVMTWQVSSPNYYRLRPGDRDWNATWPLNSNCYCPLDNGHCPCFWRMAEHAAFKSILAASSLSRRYFILRPRAATEITTPANAMPLQHNNKKLLYGRRRGWKGGNVVSSAFITVFFFSLGNVYPFFFGRDNKLFNRQILFPRGKNAFNLFRNQLMFCFLLLLPPSRCTGCR